MAPFLLPKQTYPFPGSSSEVWAKIMGVELKKFYQSNHPITTFLFVSTGIVVVLDTHVKFLHRVLHFHHKGKFIAII